MKTFPDKDCENYKKYQKKYFSISDHNSNPPEHKYQEW